ncbi:MAG: tryptophan 7-halogenase [Gemmatimonadota bacterium]|nr:tryptophan 7-halogenase [Gemmatimonadota bacterium]
MVDVVVVGGGPAGSAAAITAARAGLRVLVLERAQFPRDAVGESLHPGAETVFRRLGVWAAVEKAGFLRHRGHWLRWGSTPRFVPFGADGAGAWCGFQAWRADLDTILLEEACRAGAMIRFRCRARAPLITSGRVWGVDTDVGQVHAAVVVDATGRSGWLARSLHLKRTVASPRLLIQYGYESVCAAERHDDPMLSANELGWTWLSMVRRGVLQWMRLVICASGREIRTASPPTRTFEHFRESKGADVTWRFVPKTAGPGYFIAGDAGSVSDPSSSHGVLHALLSGALAGSLGARIVRGVAPPSRLAVLYSRWAAERFWRDARALGALYLASPAADRWLRYMPTHK